MQAEIERMIVRLMGDTSQYTQSLKTATRDTERFAKTVDRQTSKARFSFSGMGEGLLAFRKDLSRHAVRIGTVLGGMAAGAVAWGVRLAAQAEQAEISFQVMLRSTSAAKKMMAELRRFSAETPFEMPEVVAAGRQLIAFGISTEKLIPTLTALGDVSSGVGAPIGELSYLYGKAKVAGRLFMEDVNQFTERGIPIMQALARQFNVTTNDIRDMVSKGRISFADLERAFTSLTAKGGQFEGLMAKQSKSVAGLWSTLKDNVNYALQQIGETLIREVDFKGLTTDAIEFAATIDDVVVPAFKNLLRGASQSVAGIRIMWARLKAEMQGFGAFFGELIQGFANIQEWFWKGMQGPAPDWFGRGYQAQLDQIANSLYSYEKGVMDEYLAGVEAQVKRDMPVKDVDEARRSIDRTTADVRRALSSVPIAYAQPIEAAAVGSAEAMTRITAWRSGAGVNDWAKETAEYTRRMADRLDEIAQNKGGILQIADLE